MLTCLIIFYLYLHSHLQLPAIACDKNVNFAGYCWIFFLGLGCWLNYLTHFDSTCWLAIHFSENSTKCLQNAKNRKCTARYFAILFSHFAAFFCILRFAPFRVRGGILTKCQKDFIVYFFADKKFEWNAKSVE